MLLPLSLSGPLDRGSSVQLAGRQGCFNVYSAHTHNPVGLLEEEREQTLSALQNPVQLGFRAVLVDWQLTEGD